MQARSKIVDRRVEDCRSNWILILSLLGAGDEWTDGMQTTEDRRSKSGRLQIELEFHSIVAWSSRRVD